MLYFCDIAYWKKFPIFCISQLLSVYLQLKTLDIFYMASTLITLSEQDKVLQLEQFLTNFKEAGLDGNYDMEVLQKQILASPCAVNEDMGTAYKGALIVHINMAYALAKSIAQKISGTFSINSKSLLKVCYIMHLSKRYTYIENDNEWEVKNRGLVFKFNNNIDGTLKGGQKSALEALNNGVKLTPEEFESILILDSDDDSKNCIHRPIMATIVRQANELAYAIERERYRKIKASTK